MSFKPNIPAAYATTKEVVGRLFDQVGGAKRAGDLIERRKVVYDYANPHHERQVTFDQVRMLVEKTGASAPAEDLAGLAGGVFLPIAPSAECLAELQARSAREQGELFAAILGGSPGRVVLKEIDDVLRAVACLRAHVVSALEAPGAPPDEAADGGRAAFDRPGSALLRSVS